MESSKVLTGRGLKRNAISIENHRDSKRKKYAELDTVLDFGMNSVDQLNTNGRSTRSRLMGSNVMKTNRKKPYDRENITIQVNY